MEFANVGGDVKTEGLFVDKAILSPEIRHVHMLYQVFEDLCLEAEQVINEEVYGNTLGGKIYSDIAVNIYNRLYCLTQELSKEELPEGILLVPGYVGGGAGVKFPNGQVFQIVPSSRPDKYFLPASWELYSVSVNSKNEFVPGNKEFVGVDTIRKKLSCFLQINPIRPFQDESEAIYDWSGCLLYEQDIWKIIEEYERSTTSETSKVLVAQTKKELIQLYSRRGELLDEALRHYSEILQRRLNSLIEALQEKLQVSFPKIIKVNHVYQKMVDIKDQEVSYFLPATNRFIAVPTEKISLFGKILFRFPNFRKSRNLTNKEFLHHASLIGKWKILDYVSCFTKQQIMYGAKK